MGQYRQIFLDRHHCETGIALLNGLATVLLAAGTVWLVANHSGLGATEMAVLLALMLLALVGWIISTVLLMAPLRFWRRFLREQKWELLFVLVFTFGYKLTARSFPDIEEAISDLLFAPTVNLVAALDGWLGYQVAVNVATKVLGVGSFEVFIAPSCLGYQGLGLMLLFLSAHMYLGRKALRFPNALLLIPVALMAIWLLNALRIALLMVIGASWSPDIAVGGFHAGAGWLNLTLVALATVWATRRFAWFTRQQAALATPLSDDDILLLPQLTLLAVALATLLFTATFEWLYPVRVLVVGGVLLHYRKRFNLGVLRPSPVALGIGVATFVMWVLLVPAVPAQSAAFAATLFAAPTVAVAAWLAVRLVGAVLIVPLAEELAFRGFLLPRLQAACATTLPPKAAAVLATVVSSAAFGALHGAWLAATLAGVAFALARFHRGRLWDAVVAHMTTNLLLGVMVLAGGQWSYW